MKSLDLISGGFVRCSPDLVDVEQAADFVHDSTVDFFSLVTENGQRSSQATEDLLGQDSRDGFSFLCPEWESFRPLCEGIKASKYVDVSLIRPRMRSGEVDIPSFTWTAGQYRL